MLEQPTGQIIVNKNHLKADIDATLRVNAMSKMQD